MQDVHLLNKSSGWLYLLGNFSLPINFMASCLWLFLSNPSLTMALEPSPNVLNTSYPKDVLSQDDLWFFVSNS